MLTITEIHPDPPTCYLLPFRVLTWSPGDLVSFEQRLRQRVLDGCYTVTSLRRPYSLWLEAHGTSLLGMVQGTPDFTFFPTVLAWVETRLESLELSCPASRHLPIEAPETPSSLPGPRSRSNRKMYICHWYDRGRQYQATTSRSTAAWPQNQCRPESAHFLSMPGSTATSIQVHW